MQNAALRKIACHFPVAEDLKKYKKEYVKNDVVAALTVAVVAIPQSMAYALIAGVDPVYGLYTAIVSTIISSLFGSSSHLIAGPTNAIALLVASSMKNFVGADDFYEMLFLMTFVVGVLQILMGIMRLGKMINYVSHSVIVGFTAGAGVLIAFGQLNQLLGISFGNSYMTPIEKLYKVILSIGKTNIYSLALGILTIAIIIIGRKFSRYFPGALTGLIAAMALTLLFSLDKQGVKLVGDIPASLPPFKMLRLNVSSIRAVFSGAVPIAIIGLVEAISISKAIAVSSRQKLDYNQEFIGQGIANAVSSFFQCFAGSGSFTRSAINYYSGAATRLAGVGSGVLIAVILLFFAPYAKYIPQPSLAGVIMVTAYNMVNKKEMRKVSKVGKSDSIVMWTTFGATVLMPDLDWAIYMGIAISIILYLKDTNTVPVKILVPCDGSSGSFSEKEVWNIREKLDILIVQLEGHLYFGSAHDLEAKLSSLKGKAKVFILRMKTVSTIDVTAVDALRAFIRQEKEAGNRVVICGVSTGLTSIILNSGLAEEVGRDNIFISESEIFASSRKALERAKKILECFTLPPCSK